MTSVDLRPSGLTIDAIEGNAYTITFTFPNAYSLSGTWTAWLAPDPLSTPDPALTITPTVATHTVTVALSAAQTEAVASKLINLYVAQTGQVLIVAKLRTSNTTGKPTTSGVTVVVSSALSVTVDVANVAGGSVGSVTSVTAGDATITIGGTSADPTVKVTASTFQPLDSDLTAIAALATTSFGRNLLTLADAAAGRTALALGTAATNATGDFDAAGAAAAAQAASQPLDSDLTAIAALTTTAYGRSLLTAANAAALQTLASLVPGTDVQAYDVELAAIAGLTSAANKLPYFTGSGTAALADLTAFARTLIDDADAATARTTLGAASGSGSASGSNTGDQTITLTGDVTGSGTGSFAATLKNTGPGATGPSGSATVAPVVTIDAQGRVTALSTATIAIPESAVTNLTTDLAAKAMALAPTAVKTSNYTAAANDFVPCDTSGGTFTVTFPTAPADKTLIAIKLVTAGNTLNLALGGSDVFNKTGGSTTGTLTYLNQAILCQYKASGAIWYVVADDLPKSALDTVYAPIASPTFTGTVTVPASSNTTDAAQRVDTFTEAGINAQTGTTYTFVLGDAGKLVTFNNASAITASIPTNASVAFPTGTRIDVAWVTGAGQVTVNAVTSGTTTVNSTGGTATAPKLRVKWSCASLVKTATDVWLVTGDIS